MSRHHDVPTFVPTAVGTVSNELPGRYDSRFAPDRDVIKRVFTLPQLELECGATLKNVIVGYECYGELNAKGDNAIVIAHYFTGTSHAAGRYRQSDAEPGYWDAIIGPGKAIDTDRFFVVAVDCLSNLNAKNPMVFSTGPASINPATGKIYGADFPLVTISDFVRTQYALCRALGINRLHAACGPSMGSMQALEWAAQFPDYVDRVVGVIGGGLANEPYLAALLKQWCVPILLDPKFKDGNYALDEQPMAGLTASLELVTLNALSPNWAQRAFARRRANPDDTGFSLDFRQAHFSIESALTTTAHARAELTDANSFLRIAKAVQLFDLGANKNRLKAKVLWIPAKTDLLLYPVYAERGIKEMRALGLHVETASIETDGGHLDGLNQIATVAEPIREFLR